MSTPTDLPHDELRSLRERAYGPDADIHDDPAAMARLQELQAQQRADRGAVRVAASQERSETAVGGDPGAHELREGTDAASGMTSTAVLFSGNGSDGRPTHTVPAIAMDPPALDAAHEPDAPTEDRAADVADPTDPGGTVVRPWWRRRMPLLWAGSLVAALLLGAGATLAVQAVAAGQVAVLRADADAEWPEKFFGSPAAEGSTVFESFHGLTVLATPQGPPGTDSRCLYVINELGGGFGGGGCGAGAFPATASLVVGPELPNELQERFAEGTALQFVLDGGQVRVFQSSSSSGPTP